MFNDILTIINLKLTTMKTTYTLIALLGLSFSLMSQTPTVHEPVGPAIPFQHMNFDSLINAQPRSQRSVENATIKLDSSRSWKFDTLSQQWNYYYTNNYTYYPFGSIKTAESYSDQGIQVQYYDESSNVIKYTSERFVNGQLLKDFKYEYTYDSNNRKIEDLIFNIVGNEWVFSWKNNYGYDQDGNMISNLSYGWANGVWVENINLESIYSNGLLITRINNHWNSAVVQWEPFQKTNYFHDAAGNQILSHELDYAINNWVFKGKTETTYTSFNQPVRYISTRLNGTVWLNSYKVEYSYDNNENLIEKSQYMGDSQRWLNYKSEIFYYDNRKNINQHEIKYGIDTIWVNNEVTIKSYNINNQIVDYLNYRWDTVSNSWIDSYKYKNTFDQNNNLTERINYSGGIQGWKLLSKWETVVEISIPIEDIQMEHGYPYLDIYNQLIRDKRYLWSNKQWELSDTTNYYYSSLITSISEPSEISLKIYPNPTTDFIHIEGDIKANTMVRILDIKGRLVQSEQISKYANTVNVQGLISGLYFIQIQSGTDIITQTIIKQ